MKWNKTVLATLGLLIAIAALYRIIPGRPPGFAPQLAMAIFAGAVIKDRKWAIVISVLSLLVSDALYQLLFINKISSIPGFYQGQWINYLLFASVTFFGFLIRRANPGNVLLSALAAPTYFFIVSNFLTWAGVGEFVEYPKTFAGLTACYIAALPFYAVSLIATVLFSAILFSAYWIGRKGSSKPVTA